MSVASSRKVSSNSSNNEGVTCHSQVSQEGHGMALDDCAQSQLLQADAPETQEMLAGLGCRKAFSAISPNSVATLRGSCGEWKSPKFNQVLLQDVWMKCKPFQTRHEDMSARGFGANFF